MSGQLPGSAVHISDLHCKRQERIERKRLAVSRMMSNLGGKTAANGNSTSDATDFWHLTINSAARRRVLVIFSRPDLFSKTMNQVGQPSKSLGRIAPMKMVAKWEEGTLKLALAHDLRENNIEQALLQTFSRWALKVSLSSKITPRNLSSRTCFMSPKFCVES